MNKVSAKQHLKGHLLGLAVLFIAWVILVLFEVTGLLSGFIFILPFVFIFLLISTFALLPVADINIDEANGILTVTTVLKEKKVPLKDLRIMGHSYPGNRSGFILYTNKMEINTPRSRKNYDKIIKLFELTKYAGANHFKAQVQKIVDNVGSDFALPEGD